jgi:Flp pilus assembly protein TadD
MDVPLPQTTLPEAPTGAAAARPLVFGVALRTVMSARLRFPDGYTVSIDGKPVVEEQKANEFFDFRRRTAIEDGVLVAERTLAILKDEVPPDRLAALEEIRSAVAARAPFVRIRDWPWTSTSVARYDNVPGKNATASQLIAQSWGSSAPVAIGLLRKALALEPDHPMATSFLGEWLMSSGQFEEGERTMRRQIEIVPSADAYKRLGVALIQRRRWADAAVVLRNGAVAFSSDRDLPALLGEALLNDGRAAEAAVVLQAEADKRPRSSRLQSALGRAYARSGQIDRGLAALHQSVVLEDSPNIRALAALELINARRDIDRAVEYAEGAIKKTGTELQASEMASLPTGWRDAAPRFAFYAEVLGRGLLAAGNVDRAELYCRVAWEIELRNGAARCLAELADRRKDIARAEMFRVHASAFTASAATLMPAGAFEPTPEPGPPASPADAERRGVAARERTSMRSFTLPRPGEATGVAFFDVLTGPDGRVRGARSTSATAAFETVVGDLLGLKVGPELPEGNQARLMRRVRIACDVPGPSCALLVTE